MFEVFHFFDVVVEVFDFIVESLHCLLELLFLRVFGLGCFLEFDVFAVEEGEFIFFSVCQFLILLCLGLQLLLKYLGLLLSLFTPHSQLLYLRCKALQLSLKGFGSDSFLSELRFEVLSILQL